MKSQIRFLSTLFSLITLTGSAAGMAYDYNSYSDSSYSYPGSSSSSYYDSGSNYSNYSNYGQGSYGNYNYNQNNSYDNYSQGGYGDYNQGSYDNYGQSNNYDNYSQGGYDNYNYNQNNSYDNYSQSGYGNYSDYGQQQDQNVPPGPTQGSGYSDWGSGSYTDSGSSGYQEPNNNYDEEDDQDDFWDAEPQDDSALREFLNNLTLTRDSTCDEVRSLYPTLADAKRELDSETRCKPWFNERDWLEKFRKICVPTLGAILARAEECFSPFCSAMRAKFPTIENMQAALSSQALCNTGSSTKRSLCKQQPQYRAKKEEYEKALECY